MEQREAFGGSVAFRPVHGVPTEEAIDLTHHSVDDLREQVDNLALRVEYLISLVERVLVRR